MFLSDSFRPHIFGPDAGDAGERSFRDFFRLPPTKENRNQSVDPACHVCGNFVNAGRSHVHHPIWAQPNQKFLHPMLSVETETVSMEGFTPTGVP